RPRAGAARSRPRVVAGGYFMRSSLITTGVRLATAVGVVMLSTSCGGSPDDGETAEEALADTASGAAAVDTLYVSDFVTNGTNRVQRFAATTGAYLGALDPGNIGGLNGPTGLVFRRTRADKRGELLANNQNVFTNINGDVKEYSTVKGTFVRGLVL